MRQREASPVTPGPLLRKLYIGRGPDGEELACQRVDRQLVEVNTLSVWYRAMEMTGWLSVRERETEGFYLVIVVLFRSLIPVIASVFGLGSSALFHISLGLQLSDVARPRSL